LLDCTYIHCPGIGAKTEQKLWSVGARRWEDYLAQEATLRLSAAQRGRLSPVVAESVDRLAARDFAWFARHLPAREHWRAYPVFRDRIAFLDIETTGGMEPSDLTMVGMYDGETLQQFVRGQNLADFPDAIQDRALIVTFFGTGFDLPFLRRAYQMEFPQLHIDLCFLFKRLGFSGGLKRIEWEFGIKRVEETRGLSGMDAVLLWRQWQRGNRRALDTLLAYNREDVLNMAELLEIGYSAMLEKTLAGMGGVE
jgi:uncharacterized protein YprB with RNaseH-like and TPR domain